ncbi:hypothetical protein ACIOYV_01070 [Pseudomonas sp. NPDC087342]|uniref:hypothetical protein n=1 Tax=Pseudomonas sp. NPDC087342 TaxID=3364437 RepID=UPI0037F5B8FB
MNFIKVIGLRRRLNVFVFERDSKPQYSVWERSSPLKRTLCVAKGICNGRIEMLSVILAADLDRIFHMFHLEMQLA